MIQCCLAPYYMASTMRRRTKESHDLTTVFIHMHFFMPTNAQNNVHGKIYIIESKKCHQVRKILISLSFWQTSKDTMLLKCQTFWKMGEGIKDFNLKNSIFWYISFILYAWMIEKDCIDATYLQGLRFNKWAATPGDVLSCCD